MATAMFNLCDIIDEMTSLPRVQSHEDAAGQDSFALSLLKAWIHVTAREHWAWSVLVCLRRSNRNVTVLTSLVLQGPRSHQCPVAVWVVKSVHVLWVLYCRIGFQGWCLHKVSRSHAFLSLPGRNIGDSTKVVARSGPELPAWVKMADDKPDRLVIANLFCVNSDKKARISLHRPKHLFPKLS